MKFILNSSHKLLSLLEKLSFHVLQWRQLIRNWFINMKTQRFFSRIFLALAGLVVGLSIQLPVLANTELSAIRLGQTPDQTRVVFEIKNNHKFEIFKLQNPDRVVVDFMQAENGLSFQRQRFHDKRIAGMRISSNASRTRVVLDLRDNFNYKYFTLAKNGSRPERLVIDLTQPLAQPEIQLAQQEEPKAQTVVEKTIEPVAKPAPSVVAKNNVKPSENRNKANQATENLLNNNRDFLSKKEYLVAIDAGHGGRDVGAIGPTGVHEKDVTLALAKQLKEVIDSQPGMRAILTRDRDVYLNLPERVKIAKAQKADIFISVHADAYNSAAPKGGSVYVLSSNGASSVMARTLAQQENAALGVLQLAGRDKDVAYVLSDLTREANIRSSRKLGQSVLNEMQRNMKMHKHTIQSADFAVLKSIDMPSMLIEAAFISNPSEEKKLRDVRFQKTFAEAVTRGLRQFIEQTGHAPRWGEALYVNYKVRRGDTLSGLAQAYGTSSRELMNINNIQNANQLYIGRQLRMPVTDKLTVQYDVKYKVKRGDTLSEIASEHKVAVKELMKVNNIKNANQLYIGREIVVPVKQQVFAAVQ